MLASFLAQTPNILGVTKLVTSGLNLTLLEWSRKSELTADRAAFIVTEDKEVVISLLMKIAGGSSKLMNMIEYDNFLEQYKELESLMSNTSDNLILKVSTLFKNHPFPIIRAYEINKWDINQIECEVIECEVIECENIYIQPKGELWNEYIHAWWEDGIEGIRKKKKGSVSKIMKIS